MDDSKDRLFVSIMYEEGADVAAVVEEVWD